MIKTYADACIERAEKAHPQLLQEQMWNCSRNDVPELARRLKRAIEALRNEGDYDAMNQIADELESK